MFVWDTEYIYTDSCVIQTCTHQRPWGNYLMWSCTQVLSDFFFLSHKSTCLIHMYALIWDRHCFLICWILKKEAIEVEERRLLGFPLIIFVILAITDFLLRLANHSQNLRSQWRFLFDWPIRCGEFFLEVKNSEQSYLWNSVWWIAWRTGVNVFHFSGIK